MTPRWILVVSAAIGCVSPGPGSSSLAPPPAPVGPPRTFTGELRAGDDGCPNLCDPYRFTWAAPTQVSLAAVAHGATIFLKVIGPSSTETSDFGGRTSHAFTAEPNVEYTVIVDAYNYYDRGTYTLEVSPPPQVELPAPERPVPVPPTPEEIEPDDVLPAKIAELTAGWTLSKTKRGDLARVPTLTWPAKRGRCYLAVIVLEAGARKSDDWKWVGIEIDTPTLQVSTSGGFVTGSQRVISAGGDDNMCPSRSGKLILTLPHHQTRAALEDAGNGPFRVELYEKAIDTAFLDQRDREDDRDYCTSCMKQRFSCQQSGDTGQYSTCERQFNACLYNGGVKKDACRP